MKNNAAWLAILAIGLLVSFTGCKKEEQAPAAPAEAAEAVQTTTDKAAEHPETERPAADMPKDHPAH